jgi:hypothetical protein
MMHVNENSPTPRPPSLSGLLADYLRQQVDTHAGGLARPEDGEVVPFEAAPVQPVEPRLAWQEATFTLRYLHTETAPQALAVPPDWSSLVTMNEPAAAIALCLGNFPQLVRSLEPLLDPTDLEKLRPNPGRPFSCPALEEWATTAVRQRRQPQGLLALGLLRLARHFDLATELAREHRVDVPAEWQAAWTNEEGALAWHSGQPDQAATLWCKQPDSAPVHFNRGMAFLFLGRPADALPELAQAVALLPENCGWHHLACLYLALAEMRS